MVPQEQEPSLEACDKSTQAGGCKAVVCGVGTAGGVLGSADQGSIAAYATCIKGSFGLWLIQHQCLHSAPHAPCWCQVSVPLTTVWCVCCVQAISNRNMFTHHQKTVILDAPGERLPAAAAAAGNGLAAEGTEDDVSGPLPAVAAPTPTLDNLGTPTGSPKHAEGHRHRHMSDTAIVVCLLQLQLLTSFLGGSGWVSWLCKSSRQQGCFDGALCSCSEAVTCHGVYTPHHTSPEQQQINQACRAVAPCVLQVQPPQAQGAQA